VPREDERTEPNPNAVGLDTTRATIGGGYGAFVAGASYLGATILVRGGFLPAWTFLPISIGVFAAAAGLVRSAFPRKLPSAQNFPRWFLIVGTTVLGFFLFLGFVFKYPMW